VALMAAAQGARVAAVAEWYGSMPDEAAHELQHMPPVLILHGADDRVVPIFNARQLEGLLVDHGLVCSTHIFKGQGHGFSGDSLVDADTRTARFLEQYVH